MIHLAFVLSCALHAEEAKVPPAEPQNSVKTTPADSPSSPSWKKWLKDLTDQIEEMPITKPQRMSSRTAVAAVRGEKKTASAAQEPYWKGKKKSAKEEQKRKDWKALRMVLNEAQKADDPKAALSKLEEFKKDHPSSEFLPEVQKTIVQLESQPAPFVLAPAATSQTTPN